MIESCYCWHCLLRVCASTLVAIVQLLLWLVSAAGGRTNLADPAAAVAVAAAGVAPAPARLLVVLLLQP
jgi:hypothetical protein